VCQKWASRSPEKLSQAEQQFCLLVARGVKPADALDGIVRERGVNTHAMAAKWMKKAKIEREVARCKELLAEDLKMHVNCSPDDDPTADLTEVVRILPAPEPRGGCEHPANAKRTGHAAKV
jgi:hypothetical protein